MICRFIVRGFIIGKGNERGGIEVISRQDGFPEMIKEVRKWLGLTQEQLAHRLGVSWVTINRWENRKHSPSKLAQEQISKLYNETAEQNKQTSNNGNPKTEGSP